jgi:hypothetical protein
MKGWEILNLMRRTDKYLESNIWEMCAEYSAHSQSLNNKNILMQESPHNSQYGLNSLSKTLFGKQD